MNEREQPSILYCPMGRLFEPCQVEELTPIFEHLRRNLPVERQTEFQRGTHLPDGRVDLCKQCIGPVGARSLAEAAKGNAHLRHLLLGANGLGDQGAKAVAALTRENPHLETIYLGCNAIESSGAEELSQALQGNEQVTGVWLKRNPIGPAGARRLAEVLRSNRTIRTLDLVHTQMGREGLAALVAALTPDGNSAGNQSVRRLYLGGNAFGPEEADLMAQLIENNTTLHSLFLSVNRLGDRGARRIADALARNTTLQSLGLASNDIGPDGTWALSESLQIHPNLQVLDLGYDQSTSVLGERPNRIGDLGCSALAELLRANATLRSLDLCRNGIRSDGAAILLEALQENQTLTKLRVGSGVSKHVKRLLAKRLAENSERQQDLVVSDARDIQAIRSVYRG